MESTAPVVGYYYMEQMLSEWELPSLPMLFDLTGLLTLLQLHASGERKMWLSINLERKPEYTVTQGESLVLKSTEREGSCGLQSYFGTVSCPVLHCSLTVSRHFCSLRFISLAQAWVRFFSCSICISLSLSFICNENSENSNVSRELSKALKTEHVSSPVWEQGLWLQPEHWLAGATITKGSGVKTEEKGRKKN